MSDKPKKSNARSTAGVAANKTKSKKGKRGRPRNDSNAVVAATTGSKPEEDDCVIVEPNIEVIDVIEPNEEVQVQAMEHDHVPAVVPNVDNEVVHDDNDDDEDVVVTGTISPPISAFSGGRRNTKLKATSSNLSTNSNSSTSINSKRDKYGLGKRRSLRLIALGVK